MLPLLFGSFIYTFIAQPGQRRHFGAALSNRAFVARSRTAMLDSAERLLALDRPARRKGRRRAGARLSRTPCDCTRVRVIGVLVTVLLGLGPAYATEGFSADKIESARQGSLDADYQPQLPRYEEETGAGSNAGGIDGRGDGRQGPGSWQGPRRRGNGNVHGRDGDMVDTRMEMRQRGPLSDLMSFLMWGVVIVMTVLMAVWIGSKLTKYGGDAELPPSESQVDMQAIVDAIIEKPLGDADGARTYTNARAPWSRLPR